MLLWTIRGAALFQVNTLSMLVLVLFAWSPGGSETVASRQGL
jgi:hypothetical protein